MTQVERLVKIYLDSRERLLKDIHKRMLWGRSTRYQQELITAIDAELGKLNMEAFAWTQKAVESAYMRGARIAWQAAHSLDKDIKAFSAFGGLHRRAVDMLAHNTQDYLQITNNLIARQAKDLVRKLGVEVTGKKFAEALTVQEARKLLEQRLQEEQFFSVPWRNGRGSMRVDSYAELVARTTTAEATNTGTINQMQELGHNLVKMTAHNTTCKVCAPRQGRVYRTVDFAAGDPRQHFPHISLGMPRWPTYKTVHPNCAHRLLPFIWDQKTEEEQRAALADAGKQFDLDPRGEAERKRYEDAQRKNAERMRDRKQWERYRDVIGRENMPGFSGFRAMKAAGSEKYQFLRLDYSRQNRLRTNPELALPGAARATAADAKFTGYLFNPKSTSGWPKGVALTSRLGYDISNWTALRDQLLKNAGRYPVTIHREDGYGTHYEQLTVLYGNKGKPANVLVSWTNKDGHTHLTNAYVKEVKTDGAD